MKIENKYTNYQFSREQSYHLNLQDLLIKGQGVTVVLVPELGIDHEAHPQKLN